MEEIEDPWEAERYIEWLDMAALDAPFVPDKWLVKGLLEEADLVSLAGRWGSGKSYLAMAAAIAVADDTNKLFLERPVVTHGPSLYFDSESRKDKATNRLKELGATGQLKDSLFYTFESFDFQNDSDVKKILRAVRSLEPKLVVFDSFVRFLRADENDATAIARAYSRVMKPIRDAGAAVMVLDHVAKSMVSDADPNTAARGSGDKAAATDRLWLLEADPADNADLTLKFGRVKEHRTDDSMLLRRVHKSLPREVVFVKR